MVPIVAREVDAQTVPEPLAKLQWIFCRETDDFQAAAGALVSALDTDLDWVHAHTRLITRALEWEANKRSNSFVLRGEDLRSAEQWLAQAGSDKERQPTALQTEYIIASRKAAARRQRITLGAVSFGAVVAVVLAIVALVARNRAEGEKRNAETATKRATLARDEAGKLIEFMSFDLRDKLQPIGRLDLLDDVNRRVRAFYDSFTGEDESPELLRQRVRLFNNQGDVALAQGKLAAALKSYRDGLLITEQLSRQDPDSVDWQHNLSIGYNNVGDVQRAQGDLAGALKSYRDSLAIREKLSKRDPGNAPWQRDRSICHNKIGDVQRELGDRDGALKSYRDGLAIVEELSRQEPDNLAWQANLSISHGNVGDALIEQGDLAGALKSHQDSLTIRERITKQDPGNANWQRQLALCSGSVGDVQRRQGDLTGALKSYRDGLAIWEKLARQDPSNAGWQRDLSVGYSNIGNVQALQGDLAEALRSYTESLGIAERLAKEDPANADWQHDASVQYQFVSATCSVDKAIWLEPSKITAPALVLPRNWQSKIRPMSVGKATWLGVT